MALVTQMDSVFSRYKQLRMDEEDKAGIILRNREFDHHVRNFLARYPEAIVVHIGCGLDARFERVDNGQSACWMSGFPSPAPSRAWLMCDGCATFRCSPKS